MNKISLNGYAEVVNSLNKLPQNYNVQQTSLIKVVVFQTFFVKIPQQVKPTKWLQMRLSLLFKAKK